MAVLPACNSATLTLMPDASIYYHPPLARYRALRLPLSFTRCSSVRTELVASLQFINIMSTGLDSGHTAWILQSMALVQLMLPGLAFFYAGLLHRTSVVTMIM